MCTMLFLELPNFTKTFFLGCDVSVKVIGVVLMQDGQPLAFTISYKHLGQSIYEKEILSILHAMYLWNHYLLGKHFHIKIYH
jgi:hypothetical protein